LEERRNRPDLIEVSTMYKGFTKMNISELFTNDSNCSKVLGPNIVVGETRML